MISSEEGFRILGKWKTQRTLLWLAVPDLDALHGPEVRIRHVSTNPPKVTFEEGDKGETLQLDLEGVEFDKADSDESPFPNSVTKRFGFFLHLTLADKRKFVLAEPVH